MNNTLSKTLDIMRKYGIRADKSLGQNFLISDYVLDEIVEASKIEKEDLIIEIGPGLGNLTQKLLEVSNKVIAIELDTKMIEILNDRFENQKDKLIIINEDVLKCDIKEIIKNNKTLGSVKIVANLPYYITTPIIMKLLEEELGLKSITVMIQKEVAQRIVSEPGSKMCGAITSSIHYYSTPQSIITVKPENFIPSPSVDSEVIRLDILEKPKVYVKNKELFFSIIKIAFSQRRKTLLNSIVNSSLFTKEGALKMFESLQIDEKRRGETLKLEEFAKIENYITNEKRSKNGTANIRNRG